MKVYAIFLIDMRDCEFEEYTLFDDKLFYNKESALNYLKNSVAIDYYKRGDYEIRELEITELKELYITGMTDLGTSRTLVPTDIKVEEVNE